jgi:anionic cell wall polymer biosynthesis LytR-Cps2A-Psr (LCP) family protein
MNFSAAVEIIDALGGVKVYSPVAFESSLKGYKYKKGWQYLGGYKALYFARERHAFEGQDSIRVENQQIVVKAVIKKMTSSTALLTNYGDVMSAASRNMHTNMASNEMMELAKMQLTDLSEWDVQTQKIDGEYGEDYVASLTQAQKFSVFNTDPVSEKKCVDAINKVMNPTESELETARENSKKGFIMNAIYRVQNKVNDKINEKTNGSEEE